MSRWIFCCLREANGYKKFATMSEAKKFITKLKGDASLLAYLVRASMVMN